ncbi:helix-turn-helix domain-containing protein [Actinomadura flavalba]|uniref:helix-turn-helix domain-containing protein n=1 Tax=Actinomadura flavalba TaxID=1120938 RepID=UPI0003769103|nr:helix-turn-helix domain-containing protein [Actinomadura flavalba]
MGDDGALDLRRAELEREWSRRVPTGRPLADGRLVRTEIAQSWARSLAQVDPARTSAPGEDDVTARWRGSPLRTPVEELAAELRAIADDAGFVAAVTDESGTILWTCGGRVMRNRAERVNFAPGGRWDETGMGTNALSLALRDGRPARVFSAEHLVAALHGWVCYCAPIRTAQGRTLGVLDLSTTWDRSHPLAMATVRSLATAIQARLGPAAPAGRVRLDCLGTARAVRDGRPLPLRPRQIEILTLLALEPDGFSPARLRHALYGDRPVSDATLKAHVSRLRATLGGTLATRRYALTEPVACDAAAVLEALAAGDAATAVARYTGPLLPESDAPGLAEWRDHLEVAVRAAVLASRDASVALAYGERSPFDAAVHEHARRLLPPGDARRGLVAARLAAART